MLTLSNIIVEVYFQCSLLVRGAAMCIKWNVYGISTKRSTQQPKAFWPSTWPDDALRFVQFCSGPSTWPGCAKATEAGRRNAFESRRKIFTNPLLSTDLSISAICSYTFTMCGMSAIESLGYAGGREEGSLPHLDARMFVELF